MPPSEPNDLHSPTTQVNEHQVIEPQSPPTTPPGPSSVQSPAQTPKSKKTKLFKWGGLLLVLVLIAAAAILIFTSNKKDNKQPVTQNQKKDIPVLKVGYLSGPLNGIYPGGYEASSNFLEVNFQLFEGLVSYESKTKIVPKLATGWSNPDSSTWIFNIRPNIKFHTGRTMTNADVKASIDAAIANPDLELYTSTIKNVETVGSDKVKITTNGPDTILLNKLTYLYVFDTKSDKKDDPINGTGPYVVKPGTTLKEDDLDFVAVDDYHGGHVATRELKMHWYKESQDAIDAFNKGNVDIMGYLDKGTLDSLKNYEVYNVTPAGIRYLTINNAKKNSPLLKLQFRQGLEYLLDKQAITNKEQGGGEVASQMIPAEIPGHDPSIKSPVRNVAKANELFTAAGYPNGASLGLLYSALDPEVIKLIQDQLAEGGIKTTSENVEDFDTFLDRVTSGKFDLAVISYVSDFQDGSDFLKYVTNNSLYENPELNKAISDASSTLNQADRLAALKKGSQHLAANTPLLPIYYLRDNYALKKGQNYLLEPDTNQTLTQVYYWKVYQK